ncbi:MAG: hypothetical protein OXJ52_07500 [Oligoflexia bacterium]|nr:hypothetical protein [Oligoflexia bacterium]
MFRFITKKSNPIAKEAEKRACKDLSYELNTKKSMIESALIYGVFFLISLFIQEYINLQANSLMFQMVAGLVLLSYFLCIRYKFKLKKAHHYSEILKKEAYTDQKPSSLSIKKKSSPEEILKSLIQEPARGKTQWMWLVGTPPTLLLIIKGLSTKYESIELQFPTVALFLSVSCFGVLMSATVNALKGIVSIPRHGMMHIRWIKKKERPIILTVKCSLASIGFIYLISAYFLSA